MDKELLISIIINKGDCIAAEVLLPKGCAFKNNKYTDPCPLNHEGNTSSCYLEPTAYRLAVEKYIKLYGEEDFNNNLFEFLL